MTRFYVDGKWIEVDELIEKAKKYDEFTDPESGYERQARRREKLIWSLEKKLEAIKTSLDEWITSDGTLESISGIVEKILEEEK